MKYRIKKAIVLLSLLILAPAHAGLGEELTGLAAGQVVFPLVSLDTSADYSVRTLHDAADNRIKEFVTPEGKVFAVLWSGPTMPDLRRWLGEAYFDQYVNALSAAHITNRSVYINQGDLRVESSGRPGGFKGRAWLKSALPSAVVPEMLN